MKPIIKIILIAFAIIVTKLSYGQDYHPMLGDSNEWYVWHTFEGTYTEYFGAKGDTLINGRHYKLFLYSDFYRPEFPISFDTIGYLREDTITRKIYWLCDTIEDVYYDFSLNDNDSIFINIDKSTKVLYYVDSIRNANTLEGNRKIIYLSGNILGDAEFPIWIESVGTIGNPMYPEITPYQVGELSCFYKNNDKVYQSIKSQGIGKCLLNDIGVINANGDLVVYPNPTNSVIHVKWNMYEPNKLLIYDIFGKQLKVIKYPKTIDLDSFKSGVYILIFNTDFQTITKKLLIY
jgi:hypothetical protein